MSRGLEFLHIGTQPIQRPSCLVPFSSQALTGAVSTIKFFLSEAFLGQHFEAVELEGGEPEPGDLFLFRLMSPTGRWCGAHVGVYCGHGEIIHFEGKNPQGGGPHTFLGSWEGVVSKQGQRPLLHSRSLWRVLHRRGGVDRAALEGRVPEAMDADPPLYHPTRSTASAQPTSWPGISANTSEAQWLGERSPATNAGYQPPPKRAN
ncbi:uncharacterized protein LOC126087844 [Elephas maximus indicus]|uniref:uncharacterized protein LOC126087844 n=1 Tax=Elephas maximus indicus TaxID=99487 RepID=UPI0021160904|nr:uncharacterized protein LOC126087844 [Elephas maximus indicus]